MQRKPKPKLARNLKRQMSNNRKTVLISVSIPPEHLMSLDWLAKAGGRNRSQQVSWLVREAVIALEEKNLKETAGLP